jgi:ribosome maturation factor RimP
MELEQVFEEIEGKFFDLCNQIVDELNFELYDMEYLKQQKVLRVFIMDKNTGTALVEDCASVDRAFSPFFETEEWLPELTLEVSSPGMFRAIKNSKHLDMAKEKTILVLLRKTIDQEKHVDFPKRILKEKKLRGTLINYNETSLEINIDNHKVEILLETIKKASLDPDF